MGNEDNQRIVFKFFLDHFESKEQFTRMDVEKLTDWKGQTFSTYWSKQLSHLVVKVDTEHYRVGEVFRRYASWDRFKSHVTQMRPVSTDYTHLSYSIVRVYEFFMPLSNEAFLRDALDALFYTDSVEARLKTIDTAELSTAFPKQTKESDSDYRERLLAWISNHFGGYSVYHVNGRFRADVLRRRDEVCDRKVRYLVDETTAVTRFIFPCSDAAEAALVEFFFQRLFISAIIEVVNGEDEIWMVESGFNNQLHIWRTSNQ